MNKIHFIGIEQKGNSPLRDAINFFFEGKKDEDIPMLRSKQEYDDYIEENVRMSVSKRGREYFTVDVPLSNSGRG
jgi:hypothetical protein